MKIHIEGDLYLASDSHQFMIRKYGESYTNKKGEKIEPYQTLGFYPTVEHALNSFVTKKIRESTATTFKELKEDVEEIRKFIKNKIDF